jgi:hypothetical protein
MKTNRNIKIELTPEQQAQINTATGQKVEALALKPEALETRVAPGIHFN